MKGGMVVEGAAAAAGVLCAAADLGSAWLVLPCTAALDVL